jgi:hypothetical protein
MTQLTTAEAAFVNKMNPPAKRVGLGDRVRALEAATTIVTGTDGQVIICGADGVPAPATLSGAGTITNAGVLKITKIAAADADASKVFGLISTRNAADNSMYVPVATTSGYERGMKVAYAPVVNDGGYFDALYANVKVASTSTPDGIVRALEAKATIEGNMGASAEAHAVLAKINVSGASAEVSKGIGVDVVLEEESSGTLTEGIGMRVTGGAGVVSKGIQLTGAFDVGAIDIPYVDGDAAVSIAALESAFGTDDLKQGIVGLYQDDTDAVHIVVGNAATGKYQTVQLTAVAA